MAAVFNGTWTGSMALLIGTRMGIFATIMNSATGQPIQMTFGRMPKL